MISQPMGGKSEEEIAEVRVKALKYLADRGYSVPDFVVHRPLYFLARSLEAMAYCSAVYFCKDWEGYRGCRIEHDAAVAYGLEIIYEE